MRRKAYGRDFGLTTRMGLTLFLFGALYVGLFALLLQSEIGRASCRERV